ncbi:hypothetical protein L195_g007084, partial [Trifolium pratense]
RYHPAFVVQTLLYIIFTIRSNWEEHARKVQSRVERSTTTGAPTTTDSITESYNLRNLNKFPNQLIVFIAFIVLKFES